MHAVRQVGQEAFAVICRCRFHGRNLRTRVLAGVHGLSFMPGKALPAREPCKGAHPGCGRWVTGITKTERRRTDMRQHGRPLRRRSLGVVQRDVTDPSSLLSEPNGNL